MHMDGINSMLFTSDTVKLWIMFSFWVSRLIKSVFLKLTVRSIVSGIFGSNCLETYVFFTFYC